MNTIQVNFARRPAKWKPVQPAPVQEGRVNRVWLADEDEPFRQLLAQALDNTRGLECARGFGSGELLLSALAREAPPETILLDIRLRDRNGIDFIPAIKALAANTRVLVLTKFHNPEDVARALRAGASDFLLKSAPFDEIRDRILNQRPSTGIPREKIRKPTATRRIWGRARSTRAKLVPRKSCTYEIG